jgi:hypothetical protein
MTVTLHLRPELETGLLAKARARGIGLEEYLLTVVEGAAFSATVPPTPTAIQDRGEAVRRMLEFGEKHRLSLEEPVSRALLHEGHRF